MILDADHYRINVPYIADLTKEMTEEERNKFIGTLAITTSVHIIICCVYIGELYGFTPGLVDRLERLKEYYLVTEVRGIKNAQV